MKKILFAFCITCAALPAVSFSHPAASIETAPAILLASNVDVPHRPTPPTPPSVSNLRKEQPAENKEPDKKQPAPFKQQENKPAAQQPEKKAENPAEEKNTEQATEKRPAQAKQAAEKATPQEILQEAFPEEEAAEQNLAQETEKEKEKKSLPWARPIGYTAIMAALIGLTAYFYTTTPEASPKAKPRRTFSPKSRAPKSAETRQEKPQRPVKQPEPLYGAESKIKNTSLLEQLVKYDMETYGQLRSNLDYEQPAYVERLIRKYGDGDQAKINRAIHLFYISRNNK